MVRAVLADSHSLGGHQGLPESARALGPRVPPTDLSLLRQVPLSNTHPDPRKSGLAGINPAERIQLSHLVELGTDVELDADIKLSADVELDADIGPDAPWSSHSPPSGSSYPVRPSWISMSS